MAIWQVAFRLVEEHKKVRCSDSIFLHSLKELNKIFPEEKSWCEDIKQYGTLDSTCMEMLVCNDRIEDGILCRVDLRNIRKYQLQKICEFAEMNELRIEYNNVFYEATIDNLIEIIRKSDAHDFLSDPYKYIEKLKTNS